MFGTYQRLGVSIWASNREVIKAARGKLSKASRREDCYREGRKLFYRNMLEYHARAQELAREYRL